MGRTPGKSRESRAEALAALRRRIAAWVADEHGGAMAAEFVLVLPLALLMTLGVIYFSLMMYAVVTLHFAVEDAARCASVKTTICTDVAATEAYAAEKYMGPTISPTFTASAAACGNQVVGAATFNFSTGLVNTAFPFTAQACYPAAA